MGGCVCVCVCSALRSKCDRSVYNVNFNRRMEHVYNKDYEYTFGGFHDYQTTARLQFKFLTLFLLLLTLFCVCSQCKHVYRFTYF